MDCVVNNNTSHDLSQLENLVKEFLPFAQKRMGFNKPPVINFLSDKENSLNPLGKTGFYSPSDMGIGLMVDGRHIKDILRSLSHELVHHAQNCRGDFNREFSTHAGYAQDDEFLRGLEDEAYREGNFCLRDWEDGIKKQQGKYKQLNETIYIRTLREGETTMSTKDWKNEELNDLLMQKWGYSAPKKEEKKEQLNEALEPYMDEKDYSTGELHLGEEEEKPEEGEVALEDEKTPQSVDAREKRMEEREKERELKKENLSYSEKIQQSKKDNKDPFHLYENWLNEEEKKEEPKKKDDVPSKSASKKQKFDMLNALRSGNDKSLRDHFKGLAGHYFKEQGFSQEEFEPHLDTWANDALEDVKKIGDRAYNLLTKSKDEKEKAELKEAVAKFNNELAIEKGDVSGALGLLNELLDDAAKAAVTKFVKEFSTEAIEGAVKGGATAEARELAKRAALATIRRKYGKEAAEEAIKRTSKEAAQEAGEAVAGKAGKEGAKDAAKRTGKEGAEEAAEEGAEEATKKSMRERLKNLGPEAIQKLKDLCTKSGARSSACIFLATLTGLGIVGALRGGMSEEEKQMLDNMSDDDLRKLCDDKTKGDLSKEACYELRRREQTGKLRDPRKITGQGLPDPDGSLYGKPGAGQQPGTGQPKPKRFLGMSVKWLEGRGWEWMPENGDFAKKRRPDYWLSRDHCKGTMYCKKTGRKKATVKKKPMMSKKVADTGVGGADFGPGTSGMSPITRTNPNTGEVEGLTKAGQDAMNTPEVDDALKKARGGK